MPQAGLKSALQRILLRFASAARWKTAPQNLPGIPFGNWQLTALEATANVHRKTTTDDTST